MVNNRRTELDIIGKIIKLTLDGARKTEILYQGNMSYNQLQSYLLFLKENEILEEREIQDGNVKAKIYICTDKGQELLHDINKTQAYFR